MKEAPSTTVDWKHCSKDFKNTISPYEKKSANLEWPRVYGLVTFLLNMTCEHTIKS